MRHIPEAGAVCGNPARTDLRGGRGVNLRSYRNKCSVQAVCTSCSSTRASVSGSPKLSARALGQLWR